MSDFLIFDIIDIGILRRKNIKIETKNKECSVISCRIKGCSILNTDTSKLEVRPGDILYIPKGASYSQETNGEDIVYIHLKIFGNAKKEIQQTILEKPKIISEFFNQMAEIWLKKDKNYKYLCTSMLYQLVAKTSIMLNENNKDTLYPAVEYINEHFCDFDFSLEKACKLSNISRAYFNRLFKQKFNTSPISYINTLKIEKAKFLLSCKSYSHNEIAELCGFSDTKYFYTVFKKITKTTAKKYKKII